jgi:DNA-binding transcriptional LysR family regulator
MQFPDHECRALLDDYYLPVCSPELMARHPIRVSEDLRHHTLLCLNNSSAVWDTWLSLAGVDEARHARRLRFDKAYIALQAALEGLGVALAPIKLVANDIERERLVAPLRGPTVACRPIEVLYPARSGAVHRTSAFVSWLFEQAAQASGIPAAAE